MHVVMKWRLPQRVQISALPPISRIPWTGLQGLIEIEHNSSLDAGYFPWGFLSCTLGILHDLPFGKIKAVYTDKIFLRVRKTWPKDRLGLYSTFWGPDQFLRWYIIVIISDSIYSMLRLNGDIVYSCKSDPVYQNCHCFSVGREIALFLRTLIFSVF